VKRKKKWNGKIFKFISNSLTKMKGWLGYFPRNATCKKSNKIETFVQVVTELPAVMTAHLVAAKVLRKYLIKGSYSGTLKLRFRRNEAEPN